MIEISHLSPKGTFTEKAAKNIAEKMKNAELIGVTSIESVAKSVAKSVSDYGVIAYYNFLEGLVQECLDLIYEYDLNIVEVHRLPIELAAARFPGSFNTERIYSHPKALAQCSGWIGEYVPEGRQVPVESTAAGASIVREKKAGLAIAMEDTLKEYGLEVTAKEIGNKRHGRNNYTDFYLIAKENGVEWNKEKDYLTMIAITPHFDRPGLLAEMLSKIAGYGLNNAKIHSRPAIDEVISSDNGEPQMFYLEVMCHKDNPNFKECINSLEKSLKPNGKDVEVVRVLGTYEKSML